MVARLDPAICDQARLSRDRRFDGRFFVAVVTTGIYCRPVCPVRPPKAEYVRFYPSAAAAEAAGPGQRAMPEHAPAEPAAGSGRGVIVTLVLVVLAAAAGWVLRGLPGGEALRARGLRVTRLSRGVPVGSELEYVDLGTIAHALADRR